MADRRAAPGGPGATYGYQPPPPAAASRSAGASADAYFPSPPPSFQQMQSGPTLGTSTHSSPPAAQPHYAAPAGAQSSPLHMGVYDEGKLQPQPPEPFLASSGRTEPAGPAGASPAPYPAPQFPQPVARDAVVDDVIQQASQHWVANQLQQQQLYGARGPQVQLTASEDLLSGGDARDGGDANAAGDQRAWSPPAGATRPPRERPPRDVRFLLGSPRYGGRVALLIAAALFGALPLMSSLSLTVLLCGVIVTYMADYLGFVRGTVVALLGTVLAFAGALLVTNAHAALTSFGPMLMIIDLTCVLLLAAAAALLHFRWLQESFPEAICMLERCVLTLTPVLSLPSLLTTTIALVGARHSAGFFLAGMCVLHHFFYGPLRSSFMAAALRPEELQCFTGGAADPKVAAAVIGTAPPASNPRRSSRPFPFSPATLLSAAEIESGAGAGSDGPALIPQQLNERVDAVSFTVLLLLLPVAMYNVLQSNWDESVLTNLVHSVGLFCSALTYLCVTPDHSLWFLSPSLEQLLQTQGKSRGGADRTGGDLAAGELEMNPETVALLLAYDPLGLQRIIHTYRNPVLLGAAVAGAHWAVFRLFFSRYAYVFDGIPFPYNVLATLIAMYLAVYVAFQVFVLISADNAGKNVMKGEFLVRRGMIVLASSICVVIFCALGDMPGIFYFCGVMSVTSLSLFLADRNNGGPMVTFTVFSSLLLLWWMYRTFSFIVVDLSVLNGLGRIPTPLLAVSVLWSYVLGCLCFLFSFVQNKTALVVFVFLHALEVTFVEDVLCVQREEDAYPAVLVFATSAVGAAVGYRLYKNKTVGLVGASFISSCYLAKLFTFFILKTSAYYAGEMELQDVGLARTILTAEDTIGWWAALFVSFIAMIFEIERHKKLEVREATRLLYVYLFSAVVLVLCTVRTVQRAVYELVTQSYVAADELPHIAVGTALLTFALLTWPFLSRQVARYPSVRRVVAFSKLCVVLGTVLLAVQPTRVVTAQAPDAEYSMPYANRGRYASALGLGLLLASRVPLLTRLPIGARAAYWLLTAVALAFGMTMQMLPVPTFALLFCMVAFVFLILLLVDLAHYRELSSIEAWVVYGLSFCVMIASFLLIGRADLYAAARGNTVLMWELHEQGRLHLLSIVSVVNLFTAVLLKCRLAGLPLLPRCVPMTEAIASQVGVICNYACFFSTCTLAVLNFWGSDSEPGLYVVLSLFLLMLVDDEVLFFDLHCGNFRYFPSAAFALGTLWICWLYDGWARGRMYGNTMLRLYQVMVNVAYAVPLMPGQLMLLSALYEDREKAHSSSSSSSSSRAKSRGMDIEEKLTIGTLAISLTVLLISWSSILTWMAMVCAFGQCARLFWHRMTAPLPQTSRKTVS